MHSNCDHRSLSHLTLHTYLLRFVSSTFVSRQPLQTHYTIISHISYSIGILLRIFIIYIYFLVKPLSILRPLVFTKQFSHSVQVSYLLTPTLAIFFLRDKHLYICQMIQRATAVYNGHLQEPVVHALISYIFFKIWSGD